MKKLFFFVFVIISALIINNLIHSIYSLWNKDDVVRGEQLWLEKEKQKHNQLTARLTFVKSQEFIEEEARNKLFMGKSGEAEVLIDPKLIANALAKERKSEALPPWQQWMNLFFY